MSTLCTLLFFLVWKDQFLLSKLLLSLSVRFLARIRFSMTISFAPFPGALVGTSGLEPPTSRLSGARSNLLSYEPVTLSLILFSDSLYGDDGIRTHDPLLAGQVLSQLSYTPVLPGSFCSLFRSAP